MFVIGQNSFFKNLLVIASFVMFFIWGNLNSCQFPIPWKIHDRSRPKPAVIDPGSASTPTQVGQPPSDAIVLFDGHDLSKWRSEKDGPAEWDLGDGYFETVKGSGSIHTIYGFGDCQLHIEWAAPYPAKGKGQGRGNSGVFLMGKYEVQVLDSYQNETYADGQAAAVYGQYPPLVNACRPPGQWQTYDIIFHRPHFGDGGELVSAARVTVLHNGVLVQDNVEILGPTKWTTRLHYKPHPDKLPLKLQDHDNPVRFRNIWVRELPDPTLPASLPLEIRLSSKDLDRYVGVYQAVDGDTIAIKSKNDQLFINTTGLQWMEIVPESQTKFFMRMVDAEVEFKLDDNGVVDSMNLRVSGGTDVLKKVK